MAELLKRTYDLVALKVQLLETRPNIRFTLQAKVEGLLTDVAGWQSDTAELGFHNTISQQRETYDDLALSLPPAMLSAIREWIEWETSGGRPLWVHLAKPYGVLRFVPWERALGDHLPVPVLMLPDFIFPPPRESSAVLDVALCGSAPLDREEGHVHHAMRLVSRRILEAAARRTRLHIFADSALAPDLRDEYAGYGRLGVDVFVHDHDKAAPYLDADPSSRLVDRTGQLRSPWLLWMRDALRGHSVDVVHFVCHGYLTRERGAILFAQSPMERTDRYLAGPVGRTELSTFLNQVGAWSTAFTSVHDNHSEPGLRALADDIAQSRPGPLLMNAMLRDSTASSLSDAYRLLYSNLPMDAPKSSALLMYCQPYRVRVAPQAPLSGVVADPHAPDIGQVEAAGPGAWRPGRRALERSSLTTLRIEPSLLDTSPLDPVFERDEPVLPWVASTERFAEQVQLHVQQGSQTARDDDDPPDPSRDFHYRVTLQTVDRLRAAVARLVPESSLDDSAQGSAGSTGDTI